MQLEKGQTPMKSVYKFTLKKQNQVVQLRSNFDSGNMGKVEIGINNIIIITPSNDCQGSGIESHAKGWFYFAVKGFPLHHKQKFAIRKMGQLYNQSKFSQYFKPVYKYSGQQWDRIQNSLTFSKEDDTQLHFQFKFEKNSEVYFAYSFPFSYQESEKLLKKYSTEMKNHKQIYYKDQLMIRSPQGRQIHLLTISSHDLKLTTKQDTINQQMFQNSTINRAQKFAAEKKIVFISARVHPAQTPSSHTLNGLLKFLLSKDARAYLLRKNFVFKIVPMLNPDGVYHGHYRMDVFNQNLNRYYLHPDAFKHPSAFAVRSLAKYYSQQQNRLAFYIDLHAHPQRKGNFIYGNALQSQQQQIQTQLFPKILALNCAQFDYQNSSFAQKHMSAKDRNDQMTKQGCGRVVFNRIFNQIYAYTMQCGYTISPYLNQITPIPNAHRKCQKYGVIIDELDNIKSSYYSKKSVYFTIKSYQNLGKNILVSILDLFQKNQFSRIASTNFKDLNGIRKQIGIQLNKGKDYKIYAKSVIPSTKNIDSKISNYPINKVQQIQPISKKNVILRSLLPKSQKQIKFRNKTLPKMKQYK